LARNEFLRDRIGINHRAATATHEPQLAFLHERLGVILAAYRTDSEQIDLYGQGQSYRRRWDYDQRKPCEPRAVHRFRRPGSAGILAGVEVTSTRRQGCRRSRAKQAAEKCQVRIGEAHEHAGAHEIVVERR